MIETDPFKVGLYPLLMFNCKMYSDYKALILEGGGLRGVYTSGVLRFFMDREVRFSYVIGVSMGAWVAGLRDILYSLCQEIYNGCFNMLGYLVPS